MKSRQTEVLVVGAGPVGMYTALRLAQSGIQVQIIDQESGTAGHSYACALHPGSIALLAGAGIADKAMDLGCRIERIGYFQGASRQLDVSLAGLGAEYPFVLALPQSALEDLLEQRLKQMPNVTFHWHHRLRDLTMDGDEVTATVEKLAFTGGGYSVPDFQLSVAKEFQIRAHYLIGADGHASIVRRRLGIEARPAGAPELFVVYEIETEAALNRELAVVLDESTAGVMWPLGQKRCRWGFQLVPPDPPGDFSEKDRTRFVVTDVAGPDSKRLRLEKLLKVRAPWFQAGVAGLLWSTDIQFGHWSAAQFQSGRCFLVGDAAHQTGPLGMRSMNLGLVEGADLAAKINQVLRGDDSADALTAYDGEHRPVWEKLSAAQGNVQPTSKAAAWTAKNCARIAATLPLSGRDLADILGGLGIEVK
jgi:2-polyprenyl-6-methoxyphenol hydroxylase-like FAD-dependent oxidoreductase